MLSKNAFFKKISLFLQSEPILSFLIVLALFLIAIDKQGMKDAFFSIEYLVIFQILIFMLISQALELSGIFEKLSTTLITKTQSLSYFKVFLIFSVISAFSASIIMNDSAIFVFVPFLSVLIRNIKKNKPKEHLNEPLIMFMVISAINIGSALTPIGNPQNIILWRYYDIDFRQFCMYSFPIFLFLLLLLFLYVFFIQSYPSFKKELRSYFFQIKKKIASKERKKDHDLSRSKEESKEERESLKILSFPTISVRIDRSLFLLSFVLLVVNIALIEYNYILVALVITLIVYAIKKRDLIYNMDYLLLAMFFFMFWDIHYFTQYLKELNVVSHFSMNEDRNVFLYSSLLSQVISNVPATIIMKDFTEQLKPLLVGVNLGGLGFITGSMANLIAVRLTKIDVKKFLLYSLPFFFITLFLYFFLWNLF